MKMSTPSKYEAKHLANSYASAPIVPDVDPVGERADDVVAPENIDTTVALASVTIAL